MLLAEMVTDSHLGFDYLKLNNYFGSIKPKGQLENFEQIIDSLVELWH